MVKRRIVSLVLVGLAALAFAEGPDNRKAQTITIACGTSAGVGYIATSTAGTFLTKDFPGYQVKPEITTGSKENVSLIKQGIAQIGVSMADSALAAYEGNREFDPSFKGCINFVTGGYLTTITQIVPKKSKAKELPDLKGQKIGVSKGTMSQYYFPILLRAYGLSKSDFKISELSINDILTGLQDGNIQYGIHVSSVPNTGISDLALSRGIQLLTMSEPIRDAIIKENPYFQRATISKDVYKTNGDSQTLATRNIYVCSPSADEQVVYDWVKTLIKYHDDLAAAHPQAGDFGGKNGENALKGQLIPLHPGAERYYREIGLIK
jgi:TRAP transporter TAXI family solute receptor